MGPPTSNNRWFLLCRWHKLYRYATKNLCIFQNFQVIFWKGFSGLFFIFLGKDPVVLKSLGYWEYLYEAAVIAWIIFGLGYVIMIINIISDGLKAPARKIKTFATKTEKAIMSKILQEIVIIKSKVRYLTTNTGSWKLNFG